MLQHDVINIWLSALNSLENKFNSLPVKCILNQSRVFTHVCNNYRYLVQRSLVGEDHQN